MQPLPCLACSVSQKAIMSYKADANLSTPRLSVGNKGGIVGGTANAGLPSHQNNLMNYGFCELIRTQAQGDEPVSQRQSAVMLRIIAIDWASCSCTGHNNPARRRACKVVGPDRGKANCHSGSNEKHQPRLHATVGSSCA